MLQDRQEKTITKFQKKIFWIATAIRFISFLTIWNFSAGMGFLIIRSTSDILPSTMYPIAFAGIIVSVLLAILSSLKLYPSHDSTLTLLDKHNNIGGLLMAAKEVSPGAWNKSLSKDYTPPPINVSVNSQSIILIVSFIFLLTGMKVPLSDLAQNVTTKMELAELNKKAQIKIEEMEKTGIIEEKRAENLKKAIDNMHENATNENPTKTFEALDSLNKSIKRDAQKGIKKISKELENLSKLKSLATDLKSAKKKTKDTISSLSNKMKKALKNGSLTKELNNRLQSMMKKKSGTKQKNCSEAGKALSNFIKSEQKRLKEALKQLAKAHVIDKKTFDKLMKEGKIKKWEPGSGNSSTEGKEIFVTSSGKKGNGSKSGSKSKPSKSGKIKNGKGEGMGKGEGEGKGTGFSIGKGGGPTPLTFHRPSAEYKLKFNDHNLPVSSELSLEGSHAIGVAIMAPIVSDETTKVNKSDKTWINLKQHHRNSAIILPKHRSTVKQYFDRK